MQIEFMFYYPVSFFLKKYVDLLLTMLTGSQIKHVRVDKTK